MPKHTAYLAIGSNVGDRLSNIKNSIRLLGLNPRISILKSARIYESLPVGGPKNQSKYLNTAVCIKTSYNPFDLLSLLKTIEKKLKRRKEVRWGPRTIDLDIVFFNDMVLRHKELIIPHPLTHERIFVLRPLADIAAEVSHPLLKKSVVGMLKAVAAKKQQAVTVFN